MYQDGQLLGTAAGDAGDANTGVSSETWTKVGAAADGLVVSGACMTGVVVGTGGLGTGAVVGCEALGEGVSMGIEAAAG